MRAMKLAVVGAGWAGCAAAVHAAKCGAQVTVYEAARQPGGRARCVSVGGTLLDNGQHILIGAYTETLQLMRTVGVQPDVALLRLPLALHFPDGVSLRLPRLPAPLHVLGGMLLARGLRLHEKRAFVAASLAWQRGGWQAGADATVAQLAGALPARVRERFIELLCVSALNTPARDASAQVMLNVLRDSLGAARDASDFLLPRRDLGALFPQPALAWLRARGHAVHEGVRVASLEHGTQSWGLHSVQGEAQHAAHFDAVIIATPPAESARLWPALQALAAALRYEPITTAYLHAAGVRLAQPLLALLETRTQPAQFIFDRGQLGNAPGSLALVVSAATPSLGWATAQWQAAAREALAQWRIDVPVQVVKVITERRATFACTPGLARLPAALAPGLWLAGDAAQGPYPSTLEGAVRSGIAAARSACGA